MVNYCLSAEYKYRPALWVQYSFDFLASLPSPRANDIFSLFKPIWMACALCDVHYNITSTRGHYTRAHVRQYSDKRLGINSNCFQIFQKIFATNTWRIRRSHEYQYDIPSWCAQRLHRRPITDDLFLLKFIVILYAHKTRFCHSFHRVVCRIVGLNVPHRFILMRLAQSPRLACQIDRKLIMPIYIMSI